MGIRWSHIKKIDNNQCSLPDLVLRKILEYLNHCYEPETKLSPKTTVTSSRYLELGLVCSYWFLYIVPLTTKSMVLSTNGNTLHTYPKQLKQYNSYINNLNKHNNTSREPSKIALEKLELIFDTIRRPNFTLWTLFYRPRPTNTKNNRQWLPNNQVSLTKYYTNLKTIKIYRIQTASIRMESVLSTIPTLTKLSIYPSHDQRQYVQGLEQLLHSCTNIVRFTYMQKAAGFSVAFNFPCTLNKIKTTAMFMPTLPMMNLTKLHYSMNQNQRSRASAGSSKFTGELIHLLPNLVDLTLVNTYAPVYGPFLARLQHLRYLTIRDVSIFKSNDVDSYKKSKKVQRQNGDDATTPIDTFVETLLRDLDSITDRLIQLKLKDLDFDSESLWTVLNKMDLLQRLSLDTSEPVNNYVLQLIPHLELSMPSLRHVTFNVNFDTEWITRLHDFLIGNDTLTSLSIANIDHLQQTDIHSDHITVIPKQHRNSKNNLIRSIKEKVILTQNSRIPMSKHRCAIMYIEINILLLFMINLKVYVIQNQLDNNLNMFKQPA
ncbi:hypothetical protein PPL_01319 [Heterostelium album PN500]|uniref:Uncharacterized protein n=1 Tax=Heterostelium pallidum (strain ATCC 26659 / Pp 5 / PN500) TaxID=670386 RepID=D3AYQ5_HETP5|nr:hypothetical protein PPL_01319 [Heterostelium album PN500]EFA86082.1 hypothetical protein PPL_01319 [Heterostelium album PN500]|eukprot:XP_020438188.1 hypothetical protein PPL_01319 [Heterostelium album PN500]